LTGQSGHLVLIMISTKQSFSRHTIRIPDWTLPVTLLVSLNRTLTRLEYRSEAEQSFLGKTATSP